MLTHIGQFVLVELVEPHVTDEFDEWARQCAEVPINSRESELVTTTFASGQQPSNP